MTEENVLDGMISAKRGEYLEEERRFREEMEIRRIESEDQERYFNSHVRPHLRRAKPKDYRDWLEGWVEEEGAITHHYDYNLPSKFYVALSDVEIPPYTGSASIEVIVPEGVEVTYETLGHNNIYYMKGFDQAGGWVPTYDNI